MVKLLTRNFKDVLKPRNAARFLARLLAWTAILSCLTWLVSRVFGDLNLPLQFAYWIHTWAYALCALTLATLSLGFALLGRPAISDPRVYENPLARTPISRWPRRAACIASIALFTFTLVHDWRMANALASNAKASGNTVTIANWNPTITFMNTFADQVVSLDADIAFLANPPALVDWPTLRDAFTPHKDALRSRILTVISRYRVIRWGSTPLNIKGSRPHVTRWEGGGKVNIDVGHALWVEFDTTETLGKHLVVWFIDMPSDPLISRHTMFIQAAATMRDWRGPAFARGSIDQDVPLRDSDMIDRFGQDGFPPPDVILGDFNTPRHSPSVNALVPSTMHDAFDRAGFGPMGTWPRDTALFAIDQAHVAPWLRVIEYDVRNLDAGMHRAQLIEITPSK